MKNSFCALCSILFLTFIAGCNSGDSNGVPQAAGGPNTISYTRNDGSSWQVGPEMADTALLNSPKQGLAVLWKNDSLFISGLSEGNYFVLGLAVNQGLKGSYGFRYVSTNKPGSYNKFFTGPKQWWPDNDTNNVSAINLTISDVDTVNKTIIGTFTGYVNWKGDNMLVTKGKLEQVKYRRIKTAPPLVSNGTLSQNVNGVVWTPTLGYITCELRSDTLAFIGTKKGATKAEDLFFLANVKLKASRVGNYFISYNSITGGSNLLFYGSNADLLTLNTRGTIFAITGSFNVLTFDPVAKQISFDYQFSQTVSNVMTNITNGQARTVKYK
jgi:hypothetical protein